MDLFERNVCRVRSVSKASHRQIHGGEINIDMMVSMLRVTIPASPTNTKHQQRYAQRIGTSH